MEINNKIVLLGLLFLSIIHYIHTSQIRADVGSVFFFTPKMQKCQNDPINFCGQAVSEKWPDIKVTFKDYSEVKRGDVKVVSSSNEDTCIKVIHNLGEALYDGTLFQSRKSEHKEVVGYIFINPIIDDIEFLFKWFIENILNKEDVHFLNKVNSLQLIINSNKDRFLGLPFDEQCAVVECFINATCNKKKTINKKDVQNAFELVMQNASTEVEADQDEVYLCQGHSVLLAMYITQLLVCLLAIYKGSNWYVSSLCTLSTMVGLGYGGNQLYKAHQESLLT